MSKGQDVRDRNKAQLRKGAGKAAACHEECLQRLMDKSHAFAP